MCDWLGQQSRRKQEEKSTQSVFTLFSLLVIFKFIITLFAKDSFGVDANLLPNWTDADLILGISAGVNSFDPNSKTGPVVSPTD